MGRGDVFDDATLAVTVACSPRAGEAFEIALRLAAGATVRQALVASGRWADGAEPAVGVWGRPAALEQALRDRDRVEIYRPLTVDPKEARRRRQQSQRGGR